MDVCKLSKDAYGRYEFLLLYFMIQSVSPTTQHR